jgi:hypothetical protein
MAAAHIGATKSMFRPHAFSAPLCIFLWIASATLSQASRPGLASFAANRVVSVSTDPSKVALLNRVTFNKTVSQKHVDNWIVLYCVDWWELCQGIWDDYKTLAAYWERNLVANASSWQSTAIRFAEVDCTTDKALCNDNKVEEYPTVQHFRAGKLVRGWELSDGATSLSKDIAKWVRAEFMKDSNASMSIGHQSPATTYGTEIYSSMESGLHEFIFLLSWNDPVKAAIGYLVLASIVAVLFWSLATGLEIDLQMTVQSFAKSANSKARPSALLPDLPRLPEPRTIVRNSFVI